MPQRPLEAPNAGLALKLFTRRSGGAPGSDAYLRFLVEELKPDVDAHYRTLPDARHTCLMGSSMGGLISLYALCEYPQVFGGAGCLSTHWPIGGRRLVNALGAVLPRAGQHRLYFDYGTRTVDRQYEPLQQWMDRWVAAAGYRQGEDWLTRKFAGADHSERAWRVRVHIPLDFLLGE
jgi:predicted alpha/beta superfamily hydrolase